MLESFSSRRMVIGHKSPREWFWVGIRCIPSHSAGSPATSCNTLLFLRGFSVLVQRHRSAVAPPAPGHRSAVAVAANSMGTPDPEDGCDVLRAWASGVHSWMGYQGQATCVKTHLVIETLELPLGEARGDISGNSRSGGPVLGNLNRGPLRCLKLWPAHLAFKSFVKTGCLVIVWGKRGGFSFPHH